MQAYQVPNVFNESIYFDYAPVPTYAGHINRYPFRVIITSSNDLPHVIELDSENSKSYKPQERKNKWSFLRPEVKFLDLNEKEINHIVTKDTKIYLGDNGLLNTISGTFLGVSGYAEFYFVDDLYNYDLAIKNKKYSTIIATLATSGINFFDYRFTNNPEFSPHIISSKDSNSLATAKQPHIFLYRDPDYIKISENGIRPHINPRWLASNQYTVFTFNWNKNYLENFYDGNNIKVYDFDKTFNKNIPSNTNKTDINFVAKGDTLRVYFYDELKFSYKDSDDYVSSGYCKSYFNVATSVNVLHLSASCSFNSPDVKGMFYNSKLWISNPNAGLMSLVEYNAPHYIFDEQFYFPNYGADSNEYFKKPEIVSNFLKANIFNFEIPLVTATFRRNLLKTNYSDIFEAGGYHGINCIAVLPPPSFQAWAVDGDKNMLYKINTNGYILSSFDLLTIYNQASSILPRAIVNDPDQLSPTSIVLDKDKSLWISLYDNKYVLNLSPEAEFIFALDLTSHLNESSLFLDGGIASSVYGLNERIDAGNASSVYSSGYNGGKASPTFQFDQNLYDANQPYPSDDNQAQNFIEPTYVDVDSQNKIWVTYSNYMSGFLSKFDKNNNIYSNIVYPICACPQDLIINKNDDVWVALSNNIWRSFGHLEKRDTNGNLLSSFGPIIGLNNLALDLNQNLWFTYSYSRIGRIDNKNGQVYTFSIFDNQPSWFSTGTPPLSVDPELVQIQGYFDGFNPDIGLITDINVNTDETLLEGIACDSRGFIYAINSIANQIIVYDSKFYPPKLIDKFYVNPQGFNFWTQYENSNTKITNHPWGKSLQAFGDWTGFKWTNKFANLSSNYVKSVSGLSVPLNFVNIPSMQLDERFGFLSTTFYKYIYTNFSEKIKVTPRRETIVDTENFNLDFYKINENFDLSAYFKNFALMPNLAESSYLFDEFFPSIYGRFPFFHSDLGISVYEKIANFVINHSDVDTCSLDNLYSMSDALDNRNEDYMLSYPSEIKRLMDTLSINVSRLKGSVNKNQNNFEIPNDQEELNTGKLLTTNSFVTAGVPLVLKTKSLNKYELIQTGFLDDQFIYPLSALSEFLALSDPNETTSYTLVYSTENKIVNALSNFVNVINNRSKIISTPKGIIENASYKIAADNILNYKSQLQQQIIEYSQYFYPDLLTPTLSTKCYRDVGYIVDSIAADLQNNTNHRSIDVSDIYFKGPVLLNPTIYDSTVPTLPQDQVDATIAAISALNFYINGINIPSEIPSFTLNGILSSMDTGLSRRNDVSSRIEDIIYTLKNQGETKTYRPQGNPSPLDLQLADTILQQKTQIQQYMASYVEEKGYINNPDPVFNQTLKDKCNRDIGLMVDAIVHELKTGVMSKSIQYAQAYWDGNTTRLPNFSIADQQNKTIDTILELKNFILGINESLLRTVKQINSWSDYYEYYEFVPTESKIYSDNIIDWNNPQTTLINNISSVFDWWGDEQYIDSLFSYNLYKGLGIF